jgi:thymidine kinase
MSGYLELFIGPMYSGKTTQIVQLYKKFKFIGKKIIVINYIGDTRYNENICNETNLYTHDKIKIPCISINTLNDISNIINEYEIILINEGQFFSDLFEQVINYVEKYNKQVYICGLDGDFRRREFGDIIKLIPYCDKVTKLQALCADCKNGNYASFSYRIVNDESQVLIGSDIYKPLCRSCYNKYNLI